ncbi:UDP-glycosyltransferase, partial [Salinimicrobium sp. CDJ15-91]|nr:UDP-glycosyltransferase [Salinimicrobium oceani]
IEFDQVSVTGSPQFEPHFDPGLQNSRCEFFREHNLDPQKKYICFSGDDVTTSPDDPQYLNDVAEAIQELNTNGHKLGIIFRRSPVDFSGRYDKVLRQYQNLIVPITPKWEKTGEM